MKLERLRIENTRGIVTIELNVNCKSLLVSGRNGTGKSAIVDALDFLLTGEIGRIKGEGMQGVSLLKHGAHVGTEPGTAVVEATFKGRSEVTIRRRIAAPDKPEVLSGDPVEGEALLAEAPTLPFILTRRELLRFINAQPAKRLESIESLLRIELIERIRKDLQAVSKEAADASKAAAMNEIAKLAELNVEAGLTQGKLDLAGLLRRANELRKELGAPAITEMTADVTAGVIEPAAEQQVATGDWLKAMQDVETLASLVSNDATKARELSLGSLVKRLQSVQAPEVLRRAIREVDLVVQGLELLDDTGTCPLCDTPWKIPTLREHLEQKRDAARLATKLSREVEDSLRSILVEAETASRLANQLGRTLRPLVTEEVLNELDAISKIAETIGIAIADVGRNLEASDETVSLLAELGQTNRIRVFGPPLLAEIGAKAKAKPSFRQNWATLARLGLLYSQYIGLVDQAQRLGRDSLRAETVLSAFRKSREDTLASLYSSIETRFKQLYRAIHSDDESGFEAELKATKAGVDLSVGIYQFGLHPPGALHSEGHQDSMGLCLFLALAERMNSGKLHLIVLDDVVMSVDTGHRRDVIDVLGNEFPRWQFVLTTHETAWAGEIVNARLVHRENHVRFTNWSVGQGPTREASTAFWQQAKEDIEAGHVEGSATCLRRGLEESYREACGSLAGMVPFNTQERWPLEPFFRGSVGKLEALLNAGLKVVDSESATGISLNERLDALRDAKRQLDLDKWILNPVVHFNSWANFEPKEMRRILEAHRRLWNCFCCEKCGGLLRVLSDPVTTAELSVACGCNKTTWSLKKPSPRQILLSAVDEAMADIDLDKPRTSRAAASGIDP
jgi:recombinational DNA repair ATPase RecF